MVSVKSSTRSASTSVSAARREKTFRISALDGGLNLRDAEISLKDNESPEIVNLWWDEGGLRSRPGQETVASGWGSGSYSGYSFAASDVVYAAAPFEEGVVAHIGASLYTWHGQFRELRRVSGSGGVATSVPRNAGTFFRFGNVLYYKNVGGFYRLAYNASHSYLTSPLALSRVADSAYVPTVLVNADPATGQGDAYQSANRLSALRRVLYTPSASQETVVRTGNGLQRAFALGVTASENLRGVSAVYVDERQLRSALYAVDIRTGTVIFNAAPAADTTLTFALDMGALTYHLPVTGVAAVTEVTVDGLIMTPEQDYSVDAASGVVTFAQAPPVAAENSVSVTYSKADADALNEIMNCPCAADCGNGVALAGGAAARPDAAYCSGLTPSGPDISYWPMDAKAFAGGAITGLHGRTAFQSRQIGAFTASRKSVNGAERVSLSYAVLHDNIGCDMPRSIQAVGDNLLFANKSGGVYLLGASGTRNAVCISEKVNGSDSRPGLLYDLRVAGAGIHCSLNDGKRYWFAVNGHVWLCDYSLSDAKNPVWFYFTGLSPRVLSLRDGVPCMLDTPRVIRLGPTFGDFGNPVRKVYQLPARNFGSYERLKDVRAVLFSLRADTPSEVAVTYETDYETRADAVPLTVTGYDRLTERDLEVRDLSVPRHAAAFRRNPKCRHVRHFSIRLENNTAGQDLAPYSVEIRVRYEGRER